MKRPPHENAEPHAKLMAWLDSATPAEVMALSVKAGIYDEQGNLMPDYRSEETYFISGHLDVTVEEFEEQYIPRIAEAVDAGCHFVVGDARGCDIEAQRALATLGCDRVTVFHMFDTPRHNVASSMTRGGFRSDAERDQAMTAASTADIAWVRPGREKSGTAKNLKRRVARND